MLANGRIRQSLTALVCYSHSYSAVLVTEKYDLILQIFNFFQFWWKNGISSRRKLPCHGNFRKFPGSEEM